MRRPDGALLATSLQARTPLSAKVHLSLSAGMFYRTDAGLQLRDAQLGLPLLVVDRPSLRLQLTPGLTLPLGSVSAGLNYTLLATGSADPTVSAGLSVGSSWLGLADLYVRMPLYAGFDRVRSGLYSRGGLRLARRLGGGAVHLGLSAARQQRVGYSSPGFAELALTGGTTFTAGPRWSLQLDGRLPLWADPGHAPYRAALRLGATRVLGARRD